MVQAQDTQETTGGHIKSEGGGRWRQRGAGGGARDLGGMDSTSGGGHKREGKREGTTEQATIRRDWAKDMERDKVYDRG